MTGGANHGESFLLDRPGVAFVEERLEVALAFARYGILDLLVHEVVVSRPSHRAEDAHWYGVLWVLHTREDVSYRGVFSRFIVNQQVAFGYVVPYVDDFGGRSVEAVIFIPAIYDDQLFIMI